MQLTATLQSLHRLGCAQLTALVQSPHTETNREQPLQRLGARQMLWAGQLMATLQPAQVTETLHPMQLTATLQPAQVTLRVHSPQSVPRHVPAAHVPAMHVTPAHVAPPQVAPRQLTIPQGPAAAEASPHGDSRGTTSMTRSRTRNAIAYTSHDPVVARRS